MKSTKVFNSDKASLESLKKSLRLASEAEVICYLIQNYTDTWKHINMLDDRMYREHIEDTKRQGAIIL